MRHLLSCVLFYIVCFCIIQHVTSQNIIRAEYFIDNDPGVGNGIQINPLVQDSSISLNFKINHDSLLPMAHYLHVRVQDSLKRWSIFEKWKFFVHDPYVVDSGKNSGASLVLGEYFIDEDPGVGNGIALSSFGSALDIVKNEKLDLDTVTAVGPHYLHVRFKDADGIWSVYAG